VENAIKYINKLINFPHQVFYNQAKMDDIKMYPLMLIEILDEGNLLIY
jgi:hypothetical protein